MATEDHSSDIECAIKILESANAQLDSIREAFRVLKNLAEKGDVELCEGLGVWYAEGSHHLKQNPDKYLYYMKKAADAGSSFAMSDLGFSYMSGKYGVKQNTYMAHVYFYRLHKMFPDDKEYACYYALGLLNGHPTNPDSDMDNVANILLETSNSLFSQNINKAGNYSLGYSMIKDIADTGDPLACALLRSIKKSILEQIAERAVMKVLYSIINI